MISLFESFGYIIIIVFNIINPQKSYKMNTNHPIATQEVAEILSTMVMNEHGTGEAILNDADFNYLVNILEGAGESDWESLQSSQQSREAEEWRPLYTVEASHQKEGARRNGMFTGILAYENVDTFIQGMKDFPSLKRRIWIDYMI